MNKIPQEILERIDIDGCTQSMRLQDVHGNKRYMLLGAQIATDHYTPLLAQRDAENEKLTKELERVTGLLKEEFKNKWWFVVKGNEGDYSVPRAEDDIDNESEQLWNTYCKTHNINQPTGKNE